MESILSTFGIDWRLLTINIINFGVLLVGLWYFLYGPVMNMLEERKVKLAKGVEAADRAQRTLMEIETSRDKKLSEASREADELLAKAREFAAARGKDLRNAAERSAESLLAQAKREAEELKAKAIAESKKEVAKLVVLGIERELAK